LRRSYQAILATALLCTSLPSLAEHTCPQNNDYLQRDLAKTMIRELVAEGGDEARIRQVLGSAECQPKILESIARPAEKTHTWATYQKIFLQESRVQKAVEFYREHADTLARAEQTYGVPQEIILAIIGVETRYGQYMGSYRVVDALATLGFDYPPRASFFRKQLKALFELEQKAHIDANVITGSYAGAMGYGQFIPSSYQAYAVDFDGDGTVEDDPADPERLTYTWDASTRELTLSGGGSTVQVLAGGVVAADIRLRSSAWIHDGADGTTPDGTTTWQELDQSSIGNNNGAPDAAELPLIDLVSVELLVRDGDTERRFTVQADMRNRGVTA